MKSISVDGRIGEEGRPTVSCRECQGQSKPIIIVTETQQLRYYYNIANIKPAIYLSNHINKNKHAGAVVRFRKSRVCQQPMVFNKLMQP